MGVHWPIGIQKHPSPFPPAPPPSLTMPLPGSFPLPCSLQSPAKRLKAEDRRTGPIPVVGKSSTASHGSANVNRVPGSTLHTRRLISGRLPGQPAHTRTHAHGPRHD